MHDRLGLRRLDRRACVCVTPAPRGDIDDAAPAKAGRAASAAPRRRRRPPRASYWTRRTRGACLTPSISMKKDPSAHARDLDLRILQVRGAAGFLGHCQTCPFASLNVARGAQPSKSPGCALDDGSSSGCARLSKPKRCSSVGACAPTRARRRQPPGRTAQARARARKERRAESRRSSEARRRLLHRAAALQPRRRPPRRRRARRARAAPGWLFSLSFLGLA
jgi:hypothetical protein